MPEKFDLTYIDEKNQKVRPVVIHRAVFGSLDRFFGIITEHFGGAFPLWLAPIQAKIIPVSNTAHRDCAEQAHRQLKKAGIRAELDQRDEKLGYKIREAQMKKIPYIAVVGDHECRYQSVQVRQYGREDTFEESVSDFVSRIINETKQEIQVNRH